MIDDNYIINVFFTKSGKLNRCFNKFLTQDIIKYLNERFSDSESVKETLYRIKYSIEERPTCLICGNKTTFLPDIGKTCYKNGPYFTHTCCKECSNKLRDINKRKSLIDKYGVDNPFKLKHIQDHIKDITEKKYGVRCLLSKGEFRDKIDEQNIKKFGTKNLGGTKESLSKQRNTMIKRYGVENIMFLKETIDKIANTQKQNGTFRKSKEENKIYEMIRSKYPSVIRQYTDDRYINSLGNKCKVDFYIPELDMFIEYNGFFTHGGHPFDINSVEDQQKLQIMKNRYGENYWKTWAIYDVDKRNCAKLNNLNYKELWNMKEAEEFINSI